MTKQNVSILRERTMRQRPIALAGMLFVAMSVAGAAGVPRVRREPRHPYRLLALPQF